MSIHVVPAIIPQSFNDLEESVARIKGLVSRVQFDVTNGSYAPTKTWPYTSAEHFESLVGQDEGLPMWEDIEYEVDLLIKNPLEALEQWISAGVSGAIVHIETTDDHAAIFEMAQNAGLDFGWGMKPSTDVQKLFDIIETHGMPGFVQIMGNDNIGHHGVELDERVYDVVEEVRAQYPDLPIAVDIGVNEDTAAALVEAGVTKLVSGSAIFDSVDVREAIEYFESL